MSPRSMPLVGFGYDPPKMSKEEADYRPAYSHAVNQRARDEHIRGMSVRARGRIDFMEIPWGQDATEGEGQRTGVPLHRECGNCSRFNANSCKIVAGMIDHEYVCDYWRRSARAQSA